MDNIFNKPRYKSNINNPHDAVKQNEQWYKTWNTVHYLGINKNRMSNRQDNRKNLKFAIDSQ